MKYLVGSLFILLGTIGLYYFFVEKEGHRLEVKDSPQAAYEKRAVKVRKQVKEAKEREAKLSKRPVPTDKERFLDCPKVTTMLTESFKATILSWNDLLLKLKPMKEGQRVAALNQFLSQNGLPMAGWQGQGSWISERHRCGALYINFFKSVKYGDLVFETVKSKTKNQWSKPAERPLADISSDQLMIRYKVKPLCLNKCSDCVEPFDVGLRINRAGRIQVVNAPQKGRIIPSDRCPIKAKGNKPVICYEHEPTGRILVTTERCN